MSDKPENVDWPDELQHIAKEPQKLPEEKVRESVAEMFEGMSGMLGSLAARTENKQIHEIRYFQADHLTDLENAVNASFEPMALGEQVVVHPIQRYDKVWVQSVVYYRLVEPAAEVAAV